KASLKTIKLFNAGHYPQLDVAKMTDARFGPRVTRTEALASPHAARLLPQLGARLQQIVHPPRQSVTVPRCRRHVATHTRSILIGSSEAGVENQAAKNPQSAARTGLTTSCRIFKSAASGSLCNLAEWDRQARDGVAGRHSIARLLGPTYGVPGRFEILA